MTTEQDSAEWVVSDSEYSFMDVRYPTKEAAIAEGREQYMDEFFVGKAVEPSKPEDFWDAENWLEHVSCQDEYMGDHAEDWDCSTKQQRQELEEQIRPVLAAWLERHSLRPDFFNVRELEKIEN